VADRLERLSVLSRILRDLYLIDFPLFQGNGRTVEIVEAPVLYRRHKPAGF
jgi:hypothetical protein